MVRASSGTRGPQVGRGPEYRSSTSSNCWSPLRGRRGLSTSVLLPDPDLDLVRERRPFRSHTARFYECPTGVDPFREAPHLSSGTSSVTPPSVGDTTDRRFLLEPHLGSVLIAYWVPVPSLLSLRGPHPPLTSRDPATHVISPEVWSTEGLRHGDRNNRSVRTSNKSVTCLSLSLRRTHMAHTVPVPEPDPVPGGRKKGVERRLSSVTPTPGHATRDSSK